MVTVGRKINYLKRKLQMNKRARDSGNGSINEIELTHKLNHIHVGPKVRLSTHFNGYCLL